MIYNTVLESTTTDETNYLAGIKLAKFDESMSLAECFATIVAESTLEWNTIMQEASIESLIETSKIMLEADGEAADDKPKKSFKETISKMIDNLIEWFKGMGSKLFGIINSLISKLESVITSNKKIFADKKALYDGFDKLTDDQKKITVFFDPKLAGVNITAITPLAKKESEAFKSKFLNQENAEEVAKKVAQFRQDSEYAIDKYCNAIVSGSDYKTIRSKLEEKFNIEPTEMTISRETLKAAYHYATDNSGLRTNTRTIYNEVKSTINGIISDINSIKKQLNKKTEIGKASGDACTIYSKNMKKVASLVTTCLNFYLSAITKNMQGARAIAYKAYKASKSEAKAATKEDKKEQSTKESFFMDFESSFNPELI